MRSARFGPARDSALERIISHISPTEFFSAFWEKKHLVNLRQEPGYFDDLLSMTDIDTTLSTFEFRPGEHELSVVNAEREIKQEELLGGDGIYDILSVLKEYNSGSTIILNALDRKLPSLNSFTRALGREFDCRIQCNIYLTPPDAQGFDKHYDTHDVFVLQICGSKRWRIYESGNVLPLPGDSFDSERDSGGAIVDEFLLQPGDCAYIPRGIVHDAASAEVSSLHVTAGLHGAKWVDFFLAALQECAINDVSFRRQVPAGIQKRLLNSDIKSEFKELKKAFLNNVDFANVQSSFRSRLAASQPARLTNHLIQIERLAEINTNSAVRAREALAIETSRSAETFVVQANGREVAFPVTASEAIEQLLEGGTKRVSDLPSIVSDQTKLVIVRRLILEGILEFCD